MQTAMATAGDQSIEEEYEKLSERQRLKAAVHYTTLKICQETEDKYGLSVSQQVVAAIAETVWKQAESFAMDLELFAKHGKRSVINADDVKLLLRRNPCLLNHIQQLHSEQTSGREPVKKRRRKKSSKTAGDDNNEKDASPGDETEGNEQPNV